MHDGVDVRQTASVDLRRLVTLVPQDVFLFADTIRLLAGLAEPTAGQAQVLGLDRSQHLPPIKKRIGVVPETIPRNPPRPPGRLS